MESLARLPRGFACKTLPTSLPHTFPASIVHPSMQLVQRQRTVRTHAEPVFRQQLRPQSLTAGAPVAGLKKEQKKLAKALKAHRKRLDILVESAADPADRVVLADLVQELEQLNTVLSGLSTQRKAKATQSKQSAETCCKECGGSAQQEVSSSSSESEGDDCVDVQAPSAVAMTSAKARVNALVVHSMGSSVTLDVPEIVDFDTPAPVYSGAGTISVCQGSKCQGQGAVQVLQQVSQLGSRSEQVEVMPCKCLGRCGKAPAMRVKAAGQPCAVYTHVTPASAKFVLDRHFAPQQEQQAAAAASSEGQGERLLA